MGNKIYNRLDSCWNSEYSSYTDEAEWYPNPEEDIWICDVPSIQKSIRLTWNSDTETICIEERDIIKSDDLEPRYSSWKTIRKNWKH